MSIIRMSLVLIKQKKSSALFCLTGAKDITLSDMIIVIIWIYAIFDTK